MKTFKKNLSVELVVRNLLVTAFVGLIAFCAIGSLYNLYTGDFTATNWGF